MRFLLLSLASGIDYEDISAPFGNANPSRDILLERIALAISRWHATYLAAVAAELPKFGLAPQPAATRAAP